MTEKTYKKKHLTSFQLIILGFAGVILLGTVLLMLPCSTLDKVPTPFHEALFTATSAVCVTGLVLKDEATGLWQDRRLFLHLYKLVGSA